MSRNGPISGPPEALLSPRANTQRLKHFMHRSLSQRIAYLWAKSRIKTSKFSQPQNQTRHRQCAYQVYQPVLAWRKLLRQPRPTSSAPKHNDSNRASEVSYGSNLKSALPHPTVMPIPAPSSTRARPQIPAI